MRQLFLVCTLSVVLAACGITDPIEQSGLRIINSCMGTGLEACPHAWNR
jgi:hypothetical protein